jgi:hypothetical protein
MMQLPNVVTVGLLGVEILGVVIIVQPGSIAAKLTNCVLQAFGIS